MKSLKALSGGGITLLVDLTQAAPGEEREREKKKRKEKATSFATFPRLREEENLQPNLKNQQKPCLVEHFHGKYKQKSRTLGFNINTSSDKSKSVLNLKRVDSEGSGLGGDKDILSPICLEERLVRPQNLPEPDSICNQVMDVMPSFHQNHLQYGLGLSDISGQIFDYHKSWHMIDQRNWAGPSQLILVQSVLMLLIGAD